MVDVTEPLELQERLQAERDYTRSVIDTASSMIVVTDVTARSSSRTPPLTTLTGYTEDELVGRPFWEQLLTEDQREAAAQSCSATPSSCRAPARRSCAPRTTACGWSSSPPTSTTPTRRLPITYVISATDVTDARENAGMVEHLLRSARTIAFVGTDLHGRITLFNTGAEHMLGVAADEATGRELVEFIAPEDLEPLLARRRPGRLRRDRRARRRRAHPGDP